MVANYTVFVAETEQEAVVGIRDFLVNHVGWYHEWSFANTATDRHFVFASDGEPDQWLINQNPRYIGFRGNNNEIAFYTYETFDSGSYTGEISQSNTTFTSMSGPMIVTIVADKERVLFAVQTAASTYHSPAYVGRVNTLYNSAQDPYPNAVRGDNSSLGEWHESTTRSQWYAHTPGDTVRRYKINTMTSAASAGGPNVRNQDYSSFNPILYSDASLVDCELRGYVRGAYQVSNTLAHNSYLTLASGVHLVYKGTEQDSAWAYGPLKDSRIADPYEIPTYLLSVDYDYQGFVTDSNTLAHWRFDEKDEGGLCPGETGYDLTPVNNPTLSGSPLAFAIDLNGSTQKLTAAGDAAAATALTGAWTFCCSFIPDSLPVSGAWTLLEYGHNSEGTDSQNTLLSVAITSTGNVRVFWESAGGSNVENTTTVVGGFIKANRYNQLFIVKKLVISTWTVEVWHASFGNHSAILRESFTGLSNSTGGSSSSWHVGASSADTEYFNGRIDEIQIQTVEMTEIQLNEYLRRTKL